MECTSFWFNKQVIEAIDKIKSQKLVLDLLQGETNTKKSQTNKNKKAKINKQSKEEIKTKETSFISQIKDNSNNELFQEKFILTELGKPRSIDHFYNQRKLLSI